MPELSLASFSGAASLDLNGRKGRYGVAYLDAVVTAAGCDMTEPRAGADMLAFDCSVMFPEGNVRVQVKTTHSETIDGTNAHLSYTATPHWVESWRAAMVPVYFMVVVVPRVVAVDDSALWLDYHSAGTNLVNTAAYWSRIDPSTFSDDNMAVSALRSQRVDGNTIGTWHRDLIASYSPSGTS